jgi:hypothetical protein
VRRIRPQKAFAVYSPTGRVETSRPTQGEAESAAAIIGGTTWAGDGYQVLPVLILPRHPAETEADHD